MISERRLFVIQRLTAMLLAPLVIIHLGLILYAVRAGLSADDILGRTRGSLLWGGFYFLFVAAAAVHAPLGMRNILREWTTFTAFTVDRLCAVLALILLTLGARAVVAVI